MRLQAPENTPRVSLLMKFPVLTVKPLFWQLATTCLCRLCASSWRNTNQQSLESSHRSIANVAFQGAGLMIPGAGIWNVESNRSSESSSKEGRRKRDKTWSWQLNSVWFSNCEEEHQEPHQHFPVLRQHWSQRETLGTPKTDVRSVAFILFFPTKPSFFQNLLTHSSGFVICPCCASYSPSFHQTFTPFLVLSSSIFFPSSWTIRS